jgi:hypothetical protein
MRSRITVCTALLLAIFLSSSASSGTDYLPSGIENPMPVRFPQLLTAPAPSWLNEGVRGTYSALVSSSETEYLEHKDLEAGQAGNGINQLDIVAIEDGQAAIMNEAYAPGAGIQGYISASGVQGALRPLVETGSVAAVGCGDFWCSPSVLQNIPDMANNNGLTVQRLPYTDSDGQTYQAIRFDFISNDLQIALVYDLDSGVLLYHTFDYTSFSPAGLNNVPTSGSRNAQYRLLNLRPVDIPWNDGSVPSWLDTGKSVSFQGQMSIQVQGASPMNTPSALQMTSVDAHRRFAEMRLDVYDQYTGSTSSSRVVRGVAQLMGNWIPEEAISALGPCTIDTDPETGMKVSIVQNDANGVVFEKTNQMNFRELFTNDLGGRLVQAYYEYNPDVMTSSGFGSVKTIILQLVE